MKIDWVQFTKSERRALQHRIQALHSEINGILWHDYQRKIYHFTQYDSLRLLNLEVWMERYHVSLRYILQQLVPYYLEKHKEQDDGKGIACKPSGLGDKQSLRVLLKAIAHDYPQNEHIGLWRQGARRSILESRKSEEDDGVRVRHRRVTDFETPKEFIAHYDRRIRASQKEIEEVLCGPNKPYRGSPWT